MVLICFLQLSLLLWRRFFIRLLCCGVWLHKSCRTREPAQESARATVAAQERPHKRFVWKTIQNLINPHKSGRTRVHGGAAQESTPRPRTRVHAGFRTREHSNICGRRNKKTSPYIYIPPPTLRASHVYMAKVPRCTRTLREPEDT